MGISKNCSLGFWPGQKCLNIFQMLQIIQGAVDIAHLSLSLPSIAIPRAILSFSGKDEIEHTPKNSSNVLPTQPEDGVKLTYEIFATWSTRGNGVMVLGGKCAIFSWTWKRYFFVVGAMGAPYCVNLWPFCQVFLGILLTHRIQGSSFPLNSFPPLFSTYM